MSPSETWKYKCSICGELVKPGDGMTTHMYQHRDDPEWPGMMSWTRVDDPGTKR